MSHPRSSTGRTQERKFFRSHFSRREGHFPGGNFFAENPEKLLTIRQSAGIITPVVRHGTNIWGISSAGRALAWHARGHRFDPGILHQKEKHRTAMCGVFLFVRNFCLSQTSEALAQPEERRAWTARVHRDLKRPGILHQKSTVLRRKYGAFLFAEADFWGLHCFACTVFRLLQAVPVQPPTFDFTPFSKKNVCRPVFQQAAASSPSMYA